MSTLRETLAEHVACGERYCETLSGASRLATCDYCRERVDAAESVVLAWVGARLVGAREVVAEAAWRAAADFGEARDEGPRGYVFDHQAEWVIAALRDALGVPVAPAGGEVAPGATGGEIGREGGAEGFACSIDAPHGPHPVQVFIAGGEPGPVPVEWRHCPGVAICDPGCPLLGCPDCPTEATNQDHQEAK